MSQPTTGSVTLAEIARIAGVGRAAVSNWRRRHDTFPRRIGGTDASPQFSLAEIESWLREQGKLGEVGSLERLWPQFDALGDRVESGLAIAKTALARQSPSTILVSPLTIELSRPAQRLMSHAVSVAERKGARETFEFLLGRWLDRNVRQISSTPEPLARLMVEIADHVRGDHDGPYTVLDPACGTGGFLKAATELLSSADPLILVGTDREPELAALAAARLSFAPTGVDSAQPSTDLTVDVRVGDSLRADPQVVRRADLVLCNPPFNERDWGHDELATDPRWIHGLPPRTEPELAWVQHAVSRLVPGGVAVLVLPPAAATRKAGRRIRGALLRAGILRSVIALPPGCAPPHSVSLHLWVLRADDSGQSAEAVHPVRLIDAAGMRTPAAKATDGIDWIALRNAVLTALDTSGPRPDDDRVRSIALPSIDLLDDEVDLTPARHVPDAALKNARAMKESWSRFSALLADLADSGDTLATIELTSIDEAHSATTTVGELVRAGVLILLAGQLPPEGSVRAGQVGRNGLPVLTVPDLVIGGRPGGWVPRRMIAGGNLTVTAPEDVIVAGVARAFSAWVESGTGTVLGPQLYVLRVDPTLLDPWFLAGCLRAPANSRQAGTHTSSSARVDVRKLQVLQVPIAEQRRYGAAFRRITDFEHVVRQLGDLGLKMVRDLSNGLSAGQLPTNWPV